MNTHNVCFYGEIWKKISKFPSSPVAIKIQGSALQASSQNLNAIFVSVSQPKPITGLVRQSDTLSLKISFKI